jgi:hypothetical protein
MAEPFEWLLELLINAIKELWRNFWFLGVTSKRRSEIKQIKRGFCWYCAIESMQYCGLIYAPWPSGYDSTWDSVHSTTISKKRSAP